MNGLKTVRDARHAGRMPRVVIVQRILPHYRVGFFAALAERLCRSGLALQVIHGQEYPDTVPRSVTVEAPWAWRIRNVYWRVGSRELVWQPCAPLLRGAAMVIVEQANRLLLNYLLLARVRTPGSRLGFWGHGCNMQGCGDGWEERLKRMLIGRVDWWFAYTERSADIVRAAGVAAHRITVVDNAIDTRDFAAALRATGGEEVEALRRRLGIGSARVGLYCGGLYRDKKIDFLLQACALVRERVRDFHLIVIGDGPEEWKVKAAAATHPWIHFLGPKVGAERAAYFRLGRALLIPGAVGLAIVDGFVAGVPLFTTDIALHGPEIAYLESGRNGVMTRHAAAEYAAAVAECMQAPELHGRLRAGCLASARRYTLENMVERFAAGVEACLQFRGAERMTG